MCRETGAERGFAVGYFPFVYSQSEALGQPTGFRQKNVGREMPCGCVQAA